MKIDYAQDERNIFVRFLEPTNKPYFTFGGSGYNGADFHLPIEDARQLALGILKEVGHLDEQMYEIQSLKNKLERVKGILGE